MQPLALNEGVTSWQRKWDAAWQEVGSPELSYKYYIQKVNRTELSTAYSLSF